MALGLPAARLEDYEFIRKRVDGVSGGNPDLEAESADTYTAGVVLTSPFAQPLFRELRLSLDWYRIVFENAIGTRNADSVVSRCFDPQLNPDYDPANGDCSFFVRDAFTGDIFATLIDRNIGGLETSGVDAQLDWSVATPWGRLGLNENLTYVDYWRAREPNGQSTDYAGTVGGAAGTCDSALEEPL